MANTTLKMRQIAGGLDGWIPAEETWTYAAINQFTISGDKTGKYQLDDKLKLVQTTAKYFKISGISYNSPNTTVTVVATGLYSIANAAITSPSFSRMETPFGFPRSEVLLFSGTPAASVTLSETAANFRKLDIWYEGNNDGGIMGVPYYYVKLDTTLPDMAVVAVDLGYLDSVYKIRTSGGVITANGTSLTISGSGTNYSGDINAGNTVAFSDVQFIPKITRVVGIRWESV